MGRVWRRSHDKPDGSSVLQQRNELAFAPYRQGESLARCEKVLSQLNSKTAVGAGLTRCWFRALVAILRKMAGSLYVEQQNLLFHNRGTVLMKKAPGDDPRIHGGDDFTRRSIVGTGQGFEDLFVGHHTSCSLSYEWTRVGFDALQQYFARRVASWLPAAHTPVRVHPGNPLQTVLLVNLLRRCSADGGAWIALGDGG
jgi:hypothetical protein